MKRKSPTMNTVLIFAIIGTVAAVLLCTMLLFLRTYRQSLYRDASVSSRRTIAQVSGTVDEYLHDVSNVMSVLEISLEDPEVDRQEFFDTFLQIRPDAVSVSTYDAAGGLVHCYSLEHSVRADLEENLSFRAGLLEEYRDGYVSAPHVVTLFEGYYPWVVTIVSRLDTQGAEEWVALDISCTNISSYINGIGIGQRGYCFLMDADGNMVYHPQQQLI